MLNFKKKKKEEKVLVFYKNWPPARVIGSEKRGRNLFLLLNWENYHVKSKWVKADLCTEVKALGKRTILNPFGRVELTWIEKLIVNIQNWYYGRKN
jgi:hypothetical protein